MSKSPAPPRQATLISMIGEETASSLDALLPRHADFPIKGITFVDVLPLFASPSLRTAVLDSMAAAARALPVRIDAVAGFEARGFLLIGIAERLNVPFICLRKKGKLPGKRLSTEYALEYGSASLELAEAALPSNSNVLLVDDVLATGGTACAGEKLLLQAGAIAVAFATIIEVTVCGGRSNVKAPHVLTLLRV